MSDAQCELLDIGEELLKENHQDNNYTASISTDNDGLIFIKKDDCDDPFISPEISSHDMLQNL